MKLQEGDLEFDFKDAIKGFKFDETDKNKDYYHGLSHCMKAVDFILELENAYLFVEVKDFNDPENYGEKNDKFNSLKKVLKEKYRDSFLCRWAEGKVDKPIKYLCLLTLENALISRMIKELRIQLPEGNKNPRWHQSIVSGCVVANIERWNKNFPKWPVRRISSTESP